MKPWNRPANSVEKRVMSLKEKHPWITIESAKKILKKEGFKISHKGIYSIWKRYNLVNRSPENVFTTMARLSPESRRVIEYIEFILSQNPTNKIIKKVADILNALPSFPLEYEEILKKIPERYLSLSRRLNKLDAEFMEMPKSVVYQKAKRLRKAFEKKGYIYSSVLAGITEILSLHWMRTPEEELQLNALLRKRLRNLREPVINMALTFLAGTANCELLNAEQAFYYARKCKKLLHSLHHKNSYIIVGDLMTFITDYADALKYYNQALRLEKGETDTNFHLKISLASVIAGNYKRTRSLLPPDLKIGPDSEHYETYTLIKALLYLGLGNLEKATFFLRECLRRSEKSRFRNYIYTTAFCLAVIEQALGNEKEARTILQRYLPLFKKYRIDRHRIMIEFLLGRANISSIKLPIFQMVNHLEYAQKSLKIKDYKKALNYARNKGLLGFYHRVIVFFPRLITHILEKGQNPGLPRRLLHLPIFRCDIPVYYVKFLGKLIIYRNRKYLKISLRPKEKSFIIHLALRMGEPGKSVLINQLYKNFWPRSKDPSSQLSHLLVQIKKRLRLPSHLLVISQARDNKRLVNKGIYLTTDYKDFELSLVQARALLNAGEWHYARKKYISAFNLFRGRPFERMFDDWSEQMRQAILNRLENGLQEFIEQCLIHKNAKDAKKVLKRATFKDLIPTIIKVPEPK